MDELQPSLPSMPPNQEKEADRTNASLREREEESHGSCTTSDVEKNSLQTSTVFSSSELSDVHLGPDSRGENSGTVTKESTLPHTSGSTDQTSLSTSGLGTVPEMEFIPVDEHTSDSDSDIDADIALFVDKPADRDVPFEQQPSEDMEQ